MEREKFFVSASPHIHEGSSTQGLMIHVLIALMPVVVASGMGYLAEKIVEVAADNGVPVYEDNSLATMLSQLELGQEIPPSLYQAIVDIYVYFLEFDPNDPDKQLRRRTPPAAEAEEVEKEDA